MRESEKARKRESEKTPRKKAGDSGQDGVGLKPDSSLKAAIPPP